MPKTDPRERAASLIQATTYFDELGLAALAADARIVAGLLLETLQELDGERSIRQALKGRCETQQAILGKACYQALV